MPAPPASSRQLADGARGQSNARNSQSSRYVRGRRRVRARVSAVEATPAAQAPEIQTFAPSALKLTSGALSPVVRHPSESPHDIFRCSGCTEAACQVRARRCPSHRSVCPHCSAPAPHLLHPRPSGSSQLQHTKHHCGSIVSHARTSCAPQRALKISPPATLQV